MVRTIEEVRKDFRINDISISEWARERGFEPQVVIDVLNGRRKGKFGVGREVHIALGLMEATDGSHGSSQHEHKGANKGANK